MLNKKPDVKVEVATNILPSLYTQNKILIVDDEPYNLDAMRIVL